MRIIFLVIAIFFLMGSLAVKSSEVQVKDEQSWYEDEEKYENSQTSINSQTTKDNITRDNQDPTYLKLLSVERQVLMSQQMIKLYTQRLNVLQELKKQLKRKIALQHTKVDQKYQGKESKSDITPQQNNDERNIKNLYQKQTSSKDKSRTNRQNVETAAYVSLKKYEIETNTHLNTQIQDSVILIPPFLINKAKSQVSLIDEKDDSNKQARYEFGSTSKRLLFYSLQNSPEISKKNHQQNTLPTNTYVLNLALQIKPNKIKSVKITYHHRPGNQSSHSNNFEVEELVTSYQSNELISQNFRWHRALDFENLIIGFVDQTVCIKGKDRKMNEIDVGSKVLSVFSLNQYKVLFITEEKVGTINVRSFIKADQIKFQHYLGNMSLIKQKELERQKAQTSSELQQDYAHQSFDAGLYWDSPFLKNFQNLRAISAYHLQISKQFLIMLSNGDILLYSNEKIFASVNLGIQLMKELKFENSRLINFEYIASKIQIKMEILAPFKHLMITSNYHNKMLVFNITIPYLTLFTKGSGISLFSSSLRQKQLTSKYWRALQFPSQAFRKQNSECQIYISIKPIASIHILQDTVKAPSDIEEKAVHLYHCSHSPKGIKIEEHRLLLDLFEQNGFAGAISSNSQGRSWWWNIFMVVIIILGVVTFRKCKQFSQPKHEQDDLAIQRLFKQKTRSNLNYTHPGKKNPKVMTKLPQNTEKRPTTTITKIQYDNMVISELQNYLQKQGQKLTKQEIASMVRQAQYNQQKEARVKTQMKREEKTVENNSNDHLEPKQKNPKTTEEKKKFVPEQKGKPDQNTKKKKQ